MLLQLLTILGIGPAAVLSLTLLLKKSRRPGEVWLASLGLVSTYAMLIMLLYVTGAIRHVPFLVGTQTPLVFLFGPLLWLGIPGQQRLPSRSLWTGLHFLPFLVYIVLLIPVFQLPGEVKLDLVYRSFLADEPGSRTTQLIHAAVALSHMGAYFVAAHGRAASGWVWFTRVFMGLWVLLLVRTLVDHFTGLSTADTALILPSALALVACAMVWKSLSARAAERDTARDRVAYAQSARDLDYLHSHAERMHQLLIERNLYLNAELSQETLASEIGISRHDLSQLFSRALDTTFFEYVNELRIAHAAKLLSSGRADHLTMDAIATESGFGSRSSFYTWFRKLKGVSPTEWRKAEMTS